MVSGDKLIVTSNLKIITFSIIELIASTVDNPTIIDLSTNTPSKTMTLKELPGKYIMINEFITIRDVANPATVFYQAYTDSEIMDDFVVTSIFNVELEEFPTTIAIYTAAGNGLRDILMFDYMSLKVKETIKLPASIFSGDPKTKV